MSDRRKKQSPTKRNAKGKFVHEPTLAERLAPEFDADLAAIAPLPLPPKRPNFIELKRRGAEIERMVNTPHDPRPVVHKTWSLRTRALLDWATLSAADRERQRAIWAKTRLGRIAALLVDDQDHRDRDAARLAYDEARGASVQARARALVASIAEDRAQLAAAAEAQRVRDERNAKDWEEFRAEKAASRRPAVDWRDPVVGDSDIRYVQEPKTDSDRRAVLFDPDTPPPGAGGASQPKGGGGRPAAGGGVG